jgi:L-lactate dehydrogenase (cytochrome)
MEHTRMSARRLQSVLCLDDFEAAARRHLPRPLFGYIAGAAERNASLRLNAESFGRYAFVPKVMVDVSKRSQSIGLFGETYASPIGIAPMGLSALTSYRGDIVLAQAADEARVPMIMSGSSLIPLEEVARVSKSAWFQAYLPGQIPQIKALIDRVAAAGFSTLVITVDTPTQANRENNVRTGFSTPLRPSMRLAWDGLSRPSWLLGTFLRTLVRHGMPHFENNYAVRGAPILSANVVRDFSDRGHFTWEHLKLIRSLWQGPLVIKGVLSRADATMACRIGVDGIIVSNHGGRQLDGSIAPLLVLQQIVEAAGTTPVMIDSGVRRGSDVLKALALGARMAFVGRPFAYATGVAGKGGVAHGITLLKDEIARNMAMLGLCGINEMTMDRLVALDRQASPVANIATDERAA